MPVLTLHCPDCKREFKGMVMVGAKTPEVWVCAVCKGDRAVPIHEDYHTHPWAKEPSDHKHDSVKSCSCCVV